MTKYPESVLTKGKSGKIELRALVTRGKFVICKYLDPETLQLADKKLKLTLKRDDGEIEEYFLIPLKNGRYLMITPKKKEEKERKVWNLNENRAEPLWME